jgi:hypothetical protein
MKTGENKLRVIFFVLAMTSAVCAYSQSDFMLVSGTTMTADERQLEIFQQTKTCMELEDVRVIQAKNFDVLMEWTKMEAENKRTVSLRLNKETGIYVAMSLPKKKLKEKERSMFFSRAQSCLASVNILVIETKDADILQQWLKEDEEGRNVATNFNAETGVYTAVSTPKTDGNGGVKIR